MNPMAGRIEPVSYSESSIARHEAGHVVFAIATDCMPGVGTTSIWNDGDGWQGYVAVNDQGDRPHPRDESAKLDVMLPFHFREIAAKVWCELLICYAGPAAQAAFDGSPLDAASIRSHRYGGSDDGNASWLCTHFWPAEHQQEILNRAAATAGAMVQFPNVKAAIEAVSVFLTDHGRNKASVFEAGVLVRQHVPQNIPAPFQDWAVSRVKEQGQ